MSDMIEGQTPNAQEAFQQLQDQREDARNAARWCWMRLIIGRDQDAAAKRWPWIAEDQGE